MRIKSAFVPIDWFISTVVLWSRYHQTSDNILISLPLSVITRFPAPSIPCTCSIISRTIPDRYTPWELLYRAITGFLSFSWGSTSFLTLRLDTINSRSESLSLKIFPIVLVAKIISLKLSFFVYTKTGMPAARKDDTRLGGVESGATTTSGS